ncbi:hypothetical protein ANN_00744, partial [Periplaneta americana]
MLQQKVTFFQYVFLSEPFLLFYSFVLRDVFILLQYLKYIEVRAASVHFQYNNCSSPRIHVFLSLGTVVYRRVQADGLQRAYNDGNGRQVKIETHMLLAISFVPPQDVAQCFREFRDDVSDIMMPIVDCFDVNYVSGRTMQ